MSNTALLCGLLSNTSCMYLKDIFGLLGEVGIRVLQFPYACGSSCSFLTSTAHLRHEAKWLLRFAADYFHGFALLLDFFGNGVRSFQPLFVKHQMLPHGTWQHLVEMDVLPDFSSTFPIFQNQLWLGARSHAASIVADGISVRSTRNAGPTIGSSDSFEFRTVVAFYRACHTCNPLPCTPDLT